MVREGVAQFVRREQPTEIGRGLVLLALPTAYVNSSPAWSARVTSSIASAWSWKLATPGLIGFLSIRAFFFSRNATWIRGITGNRCDCTSSNRVRALMIQVCLTLCITCGRDACSSKRRDRQVHALVRRLLHSSLSLSRGVIRVRVPGDCPDADPRMRQWHRGCCRERRSLVA